MENVKATEETTTAVKGAKISLATEVMTRTKSSNGSVSYHCGDAVARALQGLGLTFVKQLAVEAMGIDVVKYEHLNPGQQRMTLGNVIRNMIRRDEGLVDKFNEVLEKVQTASDESTKEQRERDAAEAAEKARLKQEAKDAAEKEKSDKAQAKADAKAAKEKEAADKAQAKADAKEAKEKEKADKAQAKADAKAKKEREKQEAAEQKAAAKQQEQLNLGEGHPE